MLHALLHHKLQELAPEPQRLEDALTSTIFGTLLLVDGWDIFARWLKVPAGVPPSSGAPVRDLWFWPRMAFAVPDVVLRLGDLLVVVEAKYNSGRHDFIAADEDERDSGDQLVRQYRSVVTPQDSRPLYLDSIEKAIHDCRLVQVFLIDARRQRQAEREFAESRGRLPEWACLVMATWQNLYRLLKEPGVNDLRWAVDLRAYLDMAGLGTFSGFGDGGIHLHEAGGVTGWRISRTSHGLSQAVIGVGDSVVLRSLRGWHAAQPASTAVWLLAGLHRSVLSGSAGPAVLNWHAPPASRRSKARRPPGGNEQ